MMTTIKRPAAWMQRVLVGSLLVCSCLPICAEDAPARSAKRIGADAKTGIAQAVVVESAPLLFTRQFLPIDSAGRAIETKDASSQADEVWRQLSSELHEQGLSLSHLVKLNVCVANEKVASDVRRFLGERLKNHPAVAVSFVQSRLPHPEATLGIDAVAVDDRPTPFGARPRTDSLRLSSATLPALPKLYVSGQAEKGADLAEATRKTLVSLQNTLKHLGSELAGVVQVKCFLTPMSEVAAAEREIATFFGNRVPPCVFVEWQSTLPIEIELVATAWPKSDSTEPLEFITPPGMTASPVFCRVVRVNAPRTIFVSGLFAREAGDGAAQVSDVFAQLQEILKASGSDLRHLAKATYYVSDNDASAKLNELRPKFYDPARPPAASKAQVFGVGMAGRSLTLDMIAVPAK